MKSYRFKTSQVFLRVSVIMLLAGCGKDGGSSPPSLSIASISPSHGAVGTTVTLSGKGFSATAAGNTVSFNGKTADVVSATATQITATVPSLAGTGAVSVSSNGVSAQGPVFSYDTSYAVTTFAAGLSNPQYIAQEKAGNFYVTTFGNGGIAKIDAAGNVSPLAVSLIQLTGIAIDASENIYVATNNGLDTILLMRMDTKGTATLVAKIRGYAYGLATDKDNNVYIANTGDGLLQKMTPAGTVSVITGNVLGKSVPVKGLKVSSDGLIYAIESPLLVAYTQAGAGTGLYNFLMGPVNDVALDAGNNSYVTVLANTSVTKVTPGGVATVIIKSFPSPIGIIQGQDGNFYVVNSATGSSGQATGSISKISIQ